jgi:propionyl-CoA carboxylase alpha chain
LAAVKQTGAQAVHPGYGFLSESQIFAAKLHEMNVAFIGPSAYSVYAMGDKIESKRLAVKAGVHIIPGYDGVIEHAEQAVDLGK